MAGLRRSISSLGALATFEAAARHESFSRAAEELGVTQAAVSRQIKLLETELNAPLFLRAHRQVLLTEAGANLASTLTRAFGQIGEQLDFIRQPLSPGRVTIGATVAFTHFWLVPRLSEFRFANPDLNLKLVAEDGALDMRRNGLDVLFRYGKPPFEGARSVASCRNSVFPVCAPKLLQRLGRSADEVALTDLPLISSDWADPTWLSWKGWVRAAGLPARIGQASDLSRLRFNHYTDTIQAAINGEGVALGWEMLVEAHLRDGRLTRIGAHSVLPDEEYHLLIPADREPGPATRAFLAWIRACFAENT